MGRRIDGFRFISSGKVNGKRKSVQPTKVLVVKDVCYSTPGDVLLAEGDQSARNASAMCRMNLPSDGRGSKKSLRERLFS